MSMGEDEQDTSFSLRAIPGTTSIVLVHGLGLDQTINHLVQLPKRQIKEYFPPLLNSSVSVTCRIEDDPLMVHSNLGRLLQHPKFSKYALVYLSDSPGIAMFDPVVFQLVHGFELILPDGVEIYLV